jgi:hypothetical protein
MNTRDEALLEEFGLWLERYSPRRALQGNSEALQAEVKALLRVIKKYAPMNDYLSWLSRVTEALDFMMKTSAWPTVNEVGSACIATNKEAARKAPSEAISLDPIEVNAKRMNAGEAVGDGYLYGRDAVTLLRGNHVSLDVMTKYRSALFFSAKDVWGEELALRAEARWKAKHADAEELDNGNRVAMPTVSPNMMEAAK